MGKNEFKYDMKQLQERFNNFKKELQEQEDKKTRKKEASDVFRK